MKWLTGLVNGVKKVISVGKVVSAFIKALDVLQQELAKIGSNEQKTD